MFPAPDPSGAQLGQVGVFFHIPQVLSRSVAARGREMVSCCWVAYCQNKLDIFICLYLFIIYVPPSIYSSPHMYTYCIILARLVKTNLPI